MGANQVCRDHLVYVLANGFQPANTHRYAGTGFTYTTCHDLIFRNDKSNTRIRSVVEILYILLVLLVITRACGEIAVRFGQPALVGELVSGIILGMLVARFGTELPLLANLNENPVFQAITDLGVFFLMLLAGMEMRPRDITNTSGRAFFVALSGLLIPLLAGFCLGWLFLPESGVKVAQAMFIGTALSITAVPVAIRVLIDLDLLDTQAGKVVVSAAVFDDIFSLVLLAILTALISSGDFPGIQGLLLILGRTLLFFAITITVGRFVMPLLGSRVKRLKSDEFDFSFLLIMALGFAVLAELLHLHFILGAFVAGLYFGRRTIDSPTFTDVEKKVSAISGGFLGPIFFASIGYHLDLSAVTAIPLFLSLVLATAFLTKLLGAGLPARLAGLSNRAAVAVGIAMSARGAVELIIADIALEAGLFDTPLPAPPIIEHMFSTIVIIAVTTTLVVPVLLRLWLGRNNMDDIE
jgi:Na+:H+ antiporter